MILLNGEHGLLQRNFLQGVILLLPFQSKAIRTGMLITMDIWGHCLARMSASPLGVYSIISA